MLFVIKPSRTYVLMLIAAHLLVTVSVFLTNLPVWARSSLVLLLFFSLLYHLYLHLLSGQSWRSFSLEQKHLVINTMGGKELSGELSHQTLVIPQCVVLCARLDGYRFPVCQVIFKDAMQADAFRELRVRLKFS
jgi:hypothetical protein